MGLLDLIAAGYLAKRANNKLNPPQIEVPDDVILVGVKASGMNKYTIKYKKKGSTTTSTFSLSRNNRSRTGGWKFHW